MAIFHMMLYVRYQLIRVIPLIWLNLCRRHIQSLYRNCGIWATRIYFNVDILKTHASIDMDTLSNLNSLLLLNVIFMNLSLIIHDISVNILFFIVYRAYAGSWFEQFFGFGVQFCSYETKDSLCIAIRCSVCICYDDAYIKYIFELRLFVLTYM